jgi:hypothetical protein
MATKKKSKEKQKPVQKIRMGRIKAAVWANDTEKGLRYNVTLSRLYKDGETWKSSYCFGRDDLLLASKVLDRAHSWILAATQKATAEA